VSDPAATAPERRRASVLLIVSLCINAALIGLIAIALLRGFPPPREGKAGGLSPMALMRMVPAERDKIQAVMDKHRPAIRALRQRAMQARADVFERLQAPAFDRPAFDKALTSMQSADTAFETETLSATAESLALLTPEERAEVAKKVRRPHGPWLKRMFRHH
jgi:Spy/CpxP family protein refolding chaperone